MGLFIQLFDCRARLEFSLISLHKREFFSIQSGHGPEKVEQEARRLGVFEDLQQPVSIETLMSTITEAYKSKFGNAMSAAAFAETGEFDSAKKILNSDKKK